MSYRTAFDINLQNKWCSNCGDDKPQPQPYGMVENYHSNYWSTPRTAFDINLQNKWCSKCGDDKPQPQPYGMVEKFANSPKTRHDPDNVWSYTTRGCCK